MKNNSKKTKALREKEIFDHLYAANEEITSVPAKKAGSIVYLPRIFVKTSFPHRPVTFKTNDSKQPAQFFERRDHKRVFRITDASGKGLPYGVYPRLLLMLINQQAVLTKNRKIKIEDNITSLIKNLGKKTSAGPRGTNTKLKHQFESLMRCSFWFGEADQEIKDEQLFNIHDGHINSIDSLFSFPRQIVNSNEFILGERYFNLLLDNPIPLDFRALLALKFSPFAMDLYSWVTYKSYLGRGLRGKPIPDSSLMAQFGCSYEQSGEFKRHLKQAFAYVKVIYPDADMDFLRGRSRVISNTPHVPP